MKTLVNDEPLAVKYRDGTTDTIELRELSIRQLYEWIERFSDRDTPALVALATGRDAAWVDTLDDASFATLGAAAIKTNFPRAETMMRQDITVAARLLPILQLLAHAETLALGIPSPSKSPAPVASESAAASGSVSST